MKAYIKAISYYLPGDVLTNDDIHKIFPEWTVDKVASKIGIVKRHISKDDELSSDMAVKAAKVLFRDNDIDPKEVDFVLFCTQSPDYILPTTACIIQDRLGIPKSAGAMDYNLGCSGYIYGLAVAKGLILAGISKNILLLTAETYSKFIHPSDKGNRSIFGDAAAATLISIDGKASIEEFDLGTDGDGYKNLIVTKNSLRKTVDLDLGIADEYNKSIPPEYLYMNGTEIFSFTSEIVPKMISNVLKKNCLEKSDIEIYIFHQANKYMLEHLRKKLAIEEERFYYFMEEVGNTVSSTIPIALFEALKAKTLKKGQNLLLAGFGVGYSWGATVLKFND